ncbi:MAG: PHP domain-containing protein [Clostridia bacterium]|nr:PHP domain-containing protein [Clostridia bacterium]
MILTTDYHTHTVYSHGKGKIIDNALAAKEAGVKTICITDHGFSHPAYGMRRRKLDKMRNECNLAKQETGVNVLLGIESNLLGVSGKTDVKISDYDKLDVFLAGIHRFILYDTLGEWFTLLGANFLTRLFKKEPSKELIKRTTKVYINAIKNNPIDILTHPGYLVFADAEEVAKCCRDYGTLFEINSRKSHLSDDDWVKVINTGVDFVVNSDAHAPKNIGQIDYAKSLIERLEIPLDRIKNINGKTPEKLRFAEFKKGF